jgi:hypothetical protein
MSSSSTTTCNFREARTGRLAHPWPASWGRPSKQKQKTQAVCCSVLQAALCTTKARHAMGLVGAQHCLTAWHERAQGLRGATGRGNAGSSHLRPRCPFVTRGAPVPFAPGRARQDPRPRREIIKLFSELRKLCTLYRTRAPGTREDGAGARGRGQCAPAPVAALPEGSKVDYYCKNISRAPSKRA